MSDEQTDDDYDDDSVDEFTLSNDGEMLLACLIEAEEVRDRFFHESDSISLDEDTILKMGLKLYDQKVSMARAEQLMEQQNESFQDMFDRGRDR